MPVVTLLPLSAAPVGALSLGNDDDLDGGHDAFEDVDLDHVVADALDGLFETHLVLVDPQLAGLQMASETSALVTEP